METILQTLGFPVENGFVFLWTSEIHPLEALSAKAPPILFDTLKNFVSATIQRDYKISSEELTLLLALNMDDLFAESPKNDHFDYAL